MTSVTYRVVQPYGRHISTQSTLISEHPTAADAFAAIDQMVAQMIRTGAPSDAIELIVIDSAGHRVMRPGAH